MTNTPPRTPAQTFAAIINQLCTTVETWGIAGLLAMPLKNLILSRLVAIRQRFERLQARIAAGTYKPRRASATPRRRPANPGPRQPNPLPDTFGWLVTLLPGVEMYCANIAASRSWLVHLLQDPEMATLMQAAPASIARTLRPVCWMLRITPPPILALPRRPRRFRIPPTPAKAAKPQASRPPRPSSPSQRKKAVSPSSPLADQDRGGGRFDAPDARRTT